MRKPPVGRAAISEQHIADCKFGKHSYTRNSAAVQVSRPSTLRTPDEASAAKALWLFDIKVWLKSPPGLPMPLLGDYGANLETPSSAEVLAMAGGAS
jgi:hypothetical protein